MQIAGTGRSSIQANTALNFLQVPLAGVLKPSYMIIRDMQQNSILLVIRGTHSLKVHSAQFLKHVCRHPTRLHAQPEVP